MLRKSLQNYAKVKAASSHSKGSSEYASCKENIPVHGGVASPSSQYSICKPHPDKTPTSRFDHKKALAQNSWPAGPSDETLSPTVRCSNPYSKNSTHTAYCTTAAAASAFRCRRRNDQKHGESLLQQKGLAPDSVTVAPFT